MKVGFFDSGLGGLTVLGTVKLLPQEVLSNLAFVIPPIWVLLL